MHTVPRAMAGGALMALAVSCTGLATRIGGGTGPDAGLLRGKSPARAHGVTHLDRLTDGIAATPGDPWRTDLSSVLSSAEAFATYDLGRAVAIRCALIQADGRGRYTLSVSGDGARFAPLWTAPPDEDPGMQLRKARDLAGGGRYVRISAAGGGPYAVAEVDLWSACPARWPPPFAVQTGTPLDRSVGTKLWAFAALSVAFLLAVRRRAPDFVKLLVAVPIGVGLSLAVQLAEVWPWERRLVWQVLLVAGAVAAAAVVRGVVSRRSRRRASG